jgi:hypothetical protein
LEDVLGYPNHYGKFGLFCGARDMQTAKWPFCAAFSRDFYRFGAWRIFLSGGCPVESEFSINGGHAQMRSLYNFAFEHFLSAHTDFEGGRGVLGVSSISMGKAYPVP